MAPEIYDVFLSFRGCDARQDLANPLSLALNRAKFRTFLDKSDIASGDIIDSKIPDGIKHSVSAIIIFSTNYATSKWCLDELVLILERMRTSYFPLIPIYCNGVRSADVKLHNGSIYLEALEKHKKRHGEEKVKIWMEAFMEVGRRKGLRVEGRLDKFFKKVVEDVRMKITPYLVKATLPPVTETLNPKWRLHKLFQKILQDVREKKSRSIKLTPPFLVQNNENIQNVEVAPKNHIEGLGINGVTLHSHQCLPAGIQRKEESISDQATFVEPVTGDDEIHLGSTIFQDINEITSYEHESSLFDRNEEEIKQSSSESCTKKDLPGNKCWACGLGQLCVILLIAHKNCVDGLIHKLQGV